LAEGLAGPGDDEGGAVFWGHSEKENARRQRALTLGQVAFVDEGRDDMGVFQIAVDEISIWGPGIKWNALIIVGTEDVCRDRRREVAAELLLVCAGRGQDRLTGSDPLDSLVLYIDHPFRMSVAEVTFVWWAAVDLVLVEGVLDLVREDAGRET
jgi:hypothetical protein